MDEHLTKLSKFLGLILRHKPQVIGLTLDESGWASVDELIELVNQHGIPITKSLLDQVVQTNQQQNFVFNADQSRIRVGQGGTVLNQAGLLAQEPPHSLFYGASPRLLAAIRTQGLVSGSQPHIRLTVNEFLARQSFQPTGDAVIVRVAAKTMYQRGFRFFRFSDEVWLTESVPPRYLQVLARTNSFPS